jgi:zinc transporter ZupT
MNPVRRAVPSLSLLSSVTSCLGVARAISLRENTRTVTALAVAPSLNTHFLAVAAATMILVAIHELIPMAIRCQHLGWFVGTMIASVLVYGLLARRSVGQIRLIL